MTEHYAGAWAISRSIVDGDRATAIACTGSARLRAHDGAMLYDETVWFELAGKLIRATRVYRFTSGDGTIVATFADGAPFFTLRLNPDGVGAAIHHCGDDVYALTLTLRESTAWQTEWTVSGTKRIRIVTRYSR